uniref:Uncharacterized protein n=1 Tax=Romanomermis culicivorax TaxID=13658 RepID=A0A915J5D6_ROMCU
MLQQLLEVKEPLGVYMMEESLDWMVPQCSIIEKLITLLQPSKDTTEKVFLLLAFVNLDQMSTTEKSCAGVPWLFFQEKNGRIQSPMTVDYCHISS